MDRDAVLALMSQSFGRKILELIASAYRLRAGTHDAALGDNAMTFGMNVRFSIEKFLEDELISLREVDISRPVGSFQISYGGHIFHFYKFGMARTDSIDQLSFENSSTKINLVVDNQLTLPGFPDLKHWVIAHSGNPIDGLIEVFIGAPHTLGGTGSPWAWRHRVFSATPAGSENELGDGAAFEEDVWEMELHRFDKLLLTDVVE